MVKRFMALTAAAGILLFAGATRSVAADQANPVSDQQFVYQASAAGLAEINLSTLAKDRAHSEDVKKFAERMIHDHTKANKELNEVADRERLRVAPSMDQRHEMLEAQLTRLSGKDFDHAYMNAMLHDHEEAVSLFEREAKDGQNKAVKDYAEKTLPTLKEHLSMARRITGHEGKSTAESDNEHHDRTGARTNETNTDRNDRGTRTNESNANRNDRGNSRTGNTTNDNSGKNNSDKNKSGTSGSDKDQNRSDRK